MDLEEVILINITSARSELFKLVASWIKYNNVININTKTRNVIMPSEEDTIIHF